MFLLLLAVPNRFHAIIEETLGLGEVPDGELVLDAPLHIPDPEVKPLLVAARIRVRIHEQVVLLVLRIGISEHFLDVAALEVGVNKQSLGFLLDAIFLLFEILEIFIEIFNMLNRVRVYGLGRQQAVAVREVLLFSLYPMNQ